LTIAKYYRTMVDCHDVRDAVASDWGSIDSGIRIGSIGVIASDGHSFGATLVV
jgi:hypothetical protein